MLMCPCYKEMFSEKLDKVILQILVLNHHSAYFQTSKETEILYGRIYSVERIFCSAAACNDKRVGIHYFRRKVLVVNLHLCV
jgi:hypothetical protein